MNWRADKAETIRLCGGTYAEVENAYMRGEAAAGAVRLGRRAGPVKNPYPRGRRREAWADGYYMGSLPEKL